MIYIIHDEAGRISAAVDASPMSASAYAAAGYTALPGCTQNIGEVLGSYADLTTTPPTLVEREPLELTLDGLTLSGIHGPSTLHITGPVSGEFRVEDTEPVTLSFDLPGAYAVQVTPDDPRWLPCVVQVVA